MKPICRMLIMILYGSTILHAQGGWLLDKNPMNATSNFTTIYNYVCCSFMDLKGEAFVDWYAAPQALFINNGHTQSVGLNINDTVAGSRHFINLNLIETRSNHSAVAAVVNARAIINGMPVWQMREVNAQNAFQGQKDLRIHFGLGDAE